MSGVRALAACILIALMIAPAQAQERMSIADCLLRGSASIEANEVTALEGVNAWDGGAIMQAATRIGAAVVRADNGNRFVTFWAWQGGVYAFVFKPGDNPHGDCFLRIAP